MGIHDTGSLLSILIIKATNYSKLKHIFHVLYNDLTKTSPCDFVQTTTCATSFVFQKLIEACLPKQCIMESIDSCINEHKDYIQQLIKLFLKNYAVQRIFRVKKGVIYV